MHDRDTHRDTIERERGRSDELLHAILPAAAVAELKEIGRVRSRQFDDVAVPFIDFVGDDRRRLHGHVQLAGATRGLGYADAPRLRVNGAIAFNDLCVRVNP